MCLRVCGFILAVGLAVVVWWYSTVEKLSMHFCVKCVCLFQHRTLPYQLMTPDTPFSLCIFLVCGAGGVFGGGVVCGSK